MRKSHPLPLVAMLGNASGHHSDEHKAICPLLGASAEDKQDANTDAMTSAVAVACIVRLTDLFG